MNIYRRIRSLAWRASVLGLPKGLHITRYAMYDRLKTVAPQLPHRAGRVLTISRSANLVELMGLQPTEVVEADYPEYSLLALDIPDASFDMILSDQVLEHIEGDPYQAIRECHRVLRPGGWALHTTCFMNPIHEAKDFWRYTPDALSLLHRDWAEIIEVGGWGNLQVWSAVEDGIRFLGIPHATWHPLHKLAVKNDPVWPIVTWVIARK